MRAGHGGGIVDVHGHGHDGGVSGCVGGEGRVGCVCVLGCGDACCEGGGEEGECGFHFVVS